MSTYKITNITNFSTGKRDAKHNSTLDIDYVENMVKKTICVKPGNTVYLTTQRLPLSVHRLRVKGLITVSEISEIELSKLINESIPKSQKTINKNVNDSIKVPEDSKKSERKKLTRKEINPKLAESEVND
jgi:hypothetical protein